MTKQSKIIATEARIPLAVLTLSSLNPRQDVPEQDVIELAESIWAAGLIQNIAGLADKAGGACGHCSIWPSNTRIWVTPDPNWQAQW